MRCLLPVAGLCLGLGLLGGCASPPLAPAQADHAPQEVDEAGFWQAMAKEEQRLADSAARIREPELERYLAGLSCKLAEDLCGDIRVYVLRAPYFNAFMAPNGMMVLFSGLLLRSRDEAQLAFVIAHEIGHYRARHSLRNWRRTKSTASVLTAIGMLSGLGNAGGAAYAIGTLGAYLDLARFSREQEAEADAEAAAILRRAGYALQPAVELWSGALAEEEANPRGLLSAIFASHPATRQRVAELQQAAAAGSGEVDGAQAWRRQLAPLRQSWLADEVSRRNYAQSAVMLERLRGFAEGRAEVDFALAEMHRLRSQAGDLERAAELYRQALAEPAAAAQAWRQLGLVQRRLGRTKAAAEAFRHYLQAVPDAPDRALIESYLQ